MKKITGRSTDWKRQLAFIGLTCFSVFALTACLMTRDEIADEEQRKNVQQQVSTLQKNSADEQSHYTEVNEELRDLRGKVEVLDNKHTQAVKESEKNSNSTKEQLADANKHIQALQEEVQKLTNQVGYLTQEMVKLETAKPAPVAAASAKTGAAEKKADSFKTADEHFSQKNYKQAILDYQKYRDNYPNGKKFAQATYKIGMAFKELGMKDESRTFFEEVISKFPEDPLAKAARAQLKAK